MRPANIVTAVADILAGWTVTNAHYIFLNSSGLQYADTHRNLFFLILATIGLYGGGVVMNDVADFELDKIERPERPIPSGLASRKGATIFGICLLLLGICFAFMVSILSGEIAFCVAALAMIYDFFGKHHNFFGPLNMGLCRGGNLLLGMSAPFFVMQDFFLLALIPIVYIAAITMISRGEVVGGNKKAIVLAGFMYLLVIASLLFIPIYILKTKNIFFIDGFVFLFLLLIFQPLFAAYSNPNPANIRKAVKAGVISLIVMDASITCAFGGWQFGLIVLALLPISFLLAKVFAVT